MGLILTSSVREETALGSGDGAWLPIVSANFLFEAVGSAAVQCDPLPTSHRAGWNACTSAWLCANGLIPVWSKALGTVAMKQAEWYGYLDRCKCQAGPRAIESEVAK